MRYSGWVAPALALGLLGAVLYGYNENKQSGASLATLENQYQGAFHNSAFAVDAMEDSFDKALASRQPTAIKQQLQDAMHETETAQADYARLPAGISGGGMAAYLGSVRQETQRLLANHATNEPFTAADHRQIEQLQSGAARVERTMRALQANLVGYHHIFSTLAAVATNKETQRRSPIWNQFVKLETAARASVTSSDAASQSPAQGYMLPRQSAVDAALGFLHAPSGARTTVQALGDNPQSSGYLVTVGAQNPARLAVSPHGAVLWMQRDSAATGPRHASLADATRIAGQYLAAHGIRQVDIRDADIYGGKATVALSPVVRGVMLYDEPILVKVDLANRAVVGYDATDYLTHGLPLHSLKPAISSAEAVKQVSHGVRIVRSRLAVINSQTAGERLVYELMGLSAHHAYRIFIDAQNGSVVDIQRLAKDGGADVGTANPALS